MLLSPSSPRLREGSAMKSIVITSILASLVASALTSSTAAHRKYHPVAPMDSNVETVAHRRYRPPASSDANLETIINLVATWAIAYAMCKGNNASDKCNESERIADSL